MLRIAYYFLPYLSGLVYYISLFLLNLHFYKDSKNLRTILTKEITSGKDLGRRILSLKIFPVIEGDLLVESMKSETIATLLRSINDDSKAEKV